MASSKNVFILSIRRPLLIVSTNTCVRLFVHVSTAMRVCVYLCTEISKSYVYNWFIEFSRWTRTSVPTRNWGQKIKFVLQMHMRLCSFMQVLFPSSSAIMIQSISHSISPSVILFHQSRSIEDHKIGINRSLCMHLSRRYTFIDCPRATRNQKPSLACVDCISCVTQMHTAHHALPVWAVLSVRVCLPSPLFFLPFFNVSVTGNWIKEQTFLKKSVIF